MLYERAIRQLLSLSGGFFVNNDKFSSLIFRLKIPTFRNNE
jgi:hypothetical protein